MKLEIITKNNEKKGIIELPRQFNEGLRVDVIQKAVEVEQSQKRQRYGAALDAGTRHSTYVSKRRHDYKSTYGIGQSRTPRKVMSRNGARMNWVGAFAPQTVGGRQSHPPKATKIWTLKINNKEKNLAIRSGMSATLSKQIVIERGHKVPDNYPFIVEDEICTIKKSKEVVNFLKSIGFDRELERADAKKVRPGKGKMRGRKYKKKKGPLIVVADNCELLKSARSIPGVDVVKAADLTAEILSPGTLPGRATIWSKNAIEKIGEDKLFM